MYPSHTILRSPLFQGCIFFLGKENDSKDGVRVNPEPYPPAAYYFLLAKYSGIVSASSSSILVSREASRAMGRT